jgi:hypothetical protein
MMMMMMNLLKKLMRLMSKSKMMNLFKLPIKRNKY